MSPALITVPELQGRLGSVALFDLRWDLLDPASGRRRYLEGHVPGAVFVDLDRDLVGGAGGGRHPLPGTDEFVATLGRLGVGLHSDVVMYDDVGGSVAARMWWMLRDIGHRGTARLLDGGWQAWRDSGYPVAPDDVTPAPVVYPPPNRGWRSIVDRDQVAVTTHLILDARAAERYRGETEPIDPKAGHIPQAVNLPWTDNIAPDGRMIDAGGLRRRFERLGADRRPVIVSCGSGVNACHLALAMEIAGLPRPTLYPGSFSDWAGADMPVAEGPEPG